ncbi:TniQ family protein [Kordiimonas lipolytica]|uniref:TniQ family protein n=1 Tax=Kordiimonas lipolytica TaxID=1662421 RepID=A0ABV8UED4_9PROT
MIVLSGKYWPVHPKPQPFELFSSWLTRIALGNGTSAHNFCQSIWPGKQVWTRDIDVYGWKGLVETLALKTGTPPHQIINLSLSYYEGTVFEEMHGRCPTNWVLPTGIYHRIRRGFGLQWCPKCLQSDPIPYFRRHWRMAFASCCPKHGILLADRCHCCKAPAVPFRKGLVTCFQCTADLRDHPCVPALNEAIIAESELIQRAMDGRTMLPGYQPIFSIAFFDIWHRLLMYRAV